VGVGLGVNLRERLMQRMALEKSRYVTWLAKVGGAFVGMG
jgi:hypothetical protein